MVHGIAGYFVERTRCARRVSLLTLGLSLIGGILLLGVEQTPPFRHARRETVRFGFEGPEQYVRRISLEQMRGHSATLADIGDINVQTGGARGGATRRSRATVGQPQPRPLREGSGGVGGPLSMRAVSRLAGVPVFQSEELVIERLVKPDYPAALLEHNVEGKVTVQALVDTVGQVVDVQVLASTGESLFERAAEDAVWQCRFRPYRRGGEASEVYAVFRFSFKIY